MAIKTFTTGELLTASDTNTYLSNSGLVFVKQLAFTASTAASPANVDSCFSATYDNYRIVIRSVYSTNPAANLRLKMRSGTTTPTQNDWYTHIVYSTNTGGFAAIYFANQTNAIVGNAASTSALCTVEISDPFNTKQTLTTSNSVAWGVTDNIMTTCGDGLLNTTSYDGFQLYTDAGNITGTAIVYGYRKS